MSDTTMLVHGMTVDDLLAFHRARFGDARMEDGEDGGGDNGESAGAEGDQGNQEQSFTQAELDKIVKERVARERAKYADYNDLKVKAGQAKTLEERIADLERTGSESVQRALRAEIAGEFGISTKRGSKGEPSDADLFLTGADEESMRKQAERLAGRESERKKQGNHVPNEGKQTRQDGSDEMREFTRGLFESSDD